MFTALFALAKTILAAKTLGKVTIFNNNTNKWIPFVHARIPLEVLPIKFGGTNTIAQNVSKKLIKDSFGQFVSGEG